MASIRRAVEAEVRSRAEPANWSCVAVGRDAKNTDKIRFTCRDEVEAQRVKVATYKQKPGFRPVVGP